MTRLASTETKPRSFDCFLQPSCGLFRKKTAGEEAFWENCGQTDNDKMTNPQTDRSTDNKGR